MRNYTDLLQGVNLRAIQLWGNSGFRSDAVDNWERAKEEVLRGPDDGDLVSFVDNVRREAYAGFEARGRAHGHDLEDYLNAWMSQLKARCNGGDAPNRFSSVFLFDPSTDEKWREKVSAFRAEAADWDPSVRVVAVESARALRAALEFQKPLEKTIYLVGISPQEPTCKTLGRELLEQERPFYTDAARFRLDQKGYREAAQDPHGLFETDWSRAAFGALCAFYR